MMRKSAQLLLAGCLLVLPAAAQRGGGHGGGGGGFHGGMGGGGFRGGMGGGWRGGGFGPGFRGGWGWRGGGWGWRGGGWGPWGGYYPGVNFGPGWGWGYPYSSYPYSPYPYDAAGYGYSMAPPASCPQANGALLYQIKLTYQNNIHLAQKYWYTPGTLNFITVQGEENKTPIDTIDPVTFQLNQSCGMNFTLPPK